MRIHLLKIAVGVDNFADLQNRQKQRLKELKNVKQKPELIHITRHTPKRAEEVLNGGSIYWVVKGWICARQKIRELRPVLRDDVSYCGLVFDKKLVRVMPHQHRPFQGWRYFEADNAPPDIMPGINPNDIPEDMLRELGALGLL